MNTITKNHQCPHCGKFNRLTFKEMPSAKEGVQLFRGYHLAYDCHHRPIFVEWLDYGGLGVEAAA